MIRQGVLLVERRVAEHRVEAVRLYAGERVVDHKLAAILRLGHVGLDVQAAGGHCHRRLIDKHHLRLGVLLQQSQANHAVTAAEIDNLPLQIFRQVLKEEARANIQPGTGEDVGVVMDSPRRTVQRPAQGLLHIV